MKEKILKLDEDLSIYDWTLPNKSDLLHIKHARPELYPESKEKYEKDLQKYKDNIKTLKALTKADKVIGNIKIAGYQYIENKEILELLDQVKIKQIEGTLTIEAQSGVENRSPTEFNFSMFDELRSVTNLDIEGIYMTYPYAENIVPQITFPCLREVSKNTKIYHAVVDAPALTKIGTVEMLDANIDFSSQELKNKYEEYKKQNNPENFKYRGQPLSEKELNAESMGKERKSPEFER